jgi:hypothetical protein
MKRQTLSLMFAAVALTNVAMKGVSRADTSPPKPKAPRPKVSAEEKPKPAHFPKTPSSSPPPALPRPRPCYGCGRARITPETTEFLRHYLMQTKPKPV